jgi:lactate permease
VFRAWLPFIVLIVVVVLWTGPWSSLQRVVLFSFSVAEWASTCWRQG